MIYRECPYRQVNAAADIGNVYNNVIRSRPGDESRTMLSARPLHITEVRYNRVPAL